MGSSRTSWDDLEWTAGQSLSNIPHNVLSAGSQSMKFARLFVQRSRCEINDDKLTLSNCEFGKKWGKI